MRYIWANISRLVHVFLFFLPLDVNRVHVDQCRVICFSTAAAPLFFVALFSFHFVAAPLQAARPFEHNREAPAVVPPCHGGNHESTTCSCSATLLSLTAIFQGALAITV